MDQTKGQWGVKGLYKKLRSKETGEQLLTTLVKEAINEHIGSLNSEYYENEWSELLWKTGGILQIIETIHY